MAEDPFGSILAEAGSISFSQEQILRVSRFIRSARSSSSFSSSSSGDDEEGSLGITAARYRIVHRPVTMRSASDSPSSPSDSRGGGSGGEVAGSRDEGLYHREAEAEERPGQGDGEGGLGFEDHRGTEGEKRSEQSKRKRNPEEEEGERVERGAGKRSRPRVLSEESTQEPEDSPVASPSGKPVAKRLGYGGGDAEEEKPHPDRSVVEDENTDRSVSDEFAKFRHVRIGAPPHSHSPPQLLRGTHGSPKPACDDRDDGEVVKSVVIGSTREGGKGQLEMERSPRTGLGTSSPVEIREQLECEGSVGISPQTASSPRKGPLEGGNVEIKRPSDLVELLLKFSKEPDKRLEDVDFLDVLAMKGIHIPPPRWWRPGGYSPPKK